MADAGDSESQSESLSLTNAENIVNIDNWKGTEPEDIGKIAQKICDVRSTGGAGIIHHV